MTKVLWPNLFIVGAVKSGTTSLYAYLRQHPDIFFPEMKEPHFFAQPAPSREQRHLITFVGDQAEYLRLYERSGDRRWRGDASPSYLWSAQAAARIAEVSPEARIIIILRDPIERAYAQYLMDYSEGAIDRPFFEALHRDWGRPDKGWGVSQLYVELGLYTGQIQRYRALFGGDRVLVLLLEDLKKDARGVLARIARFLDIPEGPMAMVDTAQAHNHYKQPKGQWARWLAGHPVSRFLGERVMPRRLGEYIWEHWMQKDAPKPPIDPRAVAYLQQIYAPELVALEAELGRPLPELRRCWAASSHAASPPDLGTAPIHRSADVATRIPTEGAIDR
ncbi:sulfotransferase [Acidiferrobacter sp. SPIII_3]|jgi:hypothetical protein|uniref:sulfotransferase family protein n=1 Tax=Acidiferrobacter sp. SPIII_3 TaxID=1281578 RepID=UPI000D730E71|nr:sulfotransferase [Acidiferrobacter sp. SPIII_3]AWP22856.1 sulfotransferase [Acidiferrobacter sp. SPIII_3]MDA8383444.1 sulfotransferase [Betaproteobacteria bacterium]